MNMITRINPDAGVTLNNPTREEAEAAFRMIIRWAGGALNLLANVTTYW